MATAVKIIIKRRERKRKDAYAILRSTSHHHRVECFRTLPWVSLTCVITLRCIYIYIHTFFFSSCAINRRGRIFLHYFSSSCIPEDCYCQSVDRCPHRGEHVYACKTLLYHIFSFTLLFCFLIFFFSFLLLFRNRWNIKFSIRSQRSSSFSFFSFFFKE